MQVSILRADEVDYVNESKQMLEAIEKYKTMM
jgi:hypothetical protein